MKFRSDLVVEYVDHSGGDARVARSAWCLKPGQEDQRDGVEGYRRTITSMLKHKHSGPFEHGELGVYIEAPAVVWWQLTRHRFMSQEVEDFSYNLESGRYKVLDGDFYLPPVVRPCKEPEGFKPMRPALDGDLGCYANAKIRLKESSHYCWMLYQEMVNAGVGREVARMALPFNVYYAGHVSARPWTWLHFFGLRIRGGMVPSFPQWEIEQVAKKCLALFSEHWPITAGVWLEQAVRDAQA